MQETPLELCTDFSQRALLWQGPEELAMNLKKISKDSTQVLNEHIAFSQTLCFHRSDRSSEA